MLKNRWSVLALLFAVRTAMGFQFQAVPALGPYFLKSFPITVADLGLLIGLYHAPGLALALPGGAIGRRFGEKAGVLAGLAFMIVGGVMMAVATTWPVQIAGRVVAGVGGISLNVLMAKMVTDWFADKQLATAMGIFVNSWPFGIALALTVLPGIAAWRGFAFALFSVAVLLAAGLAALALLYAPPPARPGGGDAPTSTGAWPTGRALAGVFLSGAIWGMFNAGLAMIFAFGPLMLAERGMSLPAASAMTSVVLWLIVLSVPLGGYLSDRTGRLPLVLVGSLLAFAGTLLVAGRINTVLPAFVLLGIVGGLPAGPIMSLPARVLTPATRAVGMGLFFTIFYAAQGGGPWLAGLVARAAGTTRVTFDFGAALLVGCVLLYWLYGIAARRP